MAAQRNSITSRLLTVGASGQSAQSGGGVGSAGGASGGGASGGNSGIANAGALLTSWMSAATSRVTLALSGLLTTLTSGLLGLLRNLFTGLLGALVNGLRTLLVGSLAVLSATLAISVGVMVTAFRSATNAASDFARAALQIRAGTGASYGQAGATLTRGLAFGMSSQTTAGIFADQNPLIASVRGNNYYSPNYYSGLSRDYNAGMNSGPLGLMMAQANLRMKFGRDVPPEIQSIAAMDPGKVAAQEKWSNGIGARLGMKPGDIARYAEDFQLAGAKTATILELLKLKLAAAIGPQLIAGMEKVAEFFTRNSDRIARVLERVGVVLSAVFLRGLEVLLVWLDSNGDRIGTWFQEAFDWILNTAPPLFMRAAAFIARALSHILLFFANGITRLLDNVPQLSAFFNRLTESFNRNLPILRKAGEDLIAIIGSIAQGIRDLSGTSSEEKEKEEEGKEEKKKEGKKEEGKEEKKKEGTDEPKQDNGVDSPSGTSSSSMLVTILQWVGKTVRKVGNAVGLTSGDPDKPGLVNNIVNSAVGVIIARYLAAPAARLGGALIVRAISAAVPVVRAVGPVVAARVGVAAAPLVAPALALAGNPLVVGIGLGTWAGSHIYDRFRHRRGHTLPSTGQLVSYTYNRIRGYSDYDAALIALGGNPDSAAGKNKVPGKHKGPAKTEGTERPSLTRQITSIASQGNSALQSGLTSFSQWGPGVADTVRQGADLLNSQADSLDGKASSWQSDLAALLAKIERNTGTTARNTEEQADAARELGFGLNVLGRAIAYAGQDVALAAVR